jgi:hypothetical protein
MIFNPFITIPANPKSHVRGWALHWSECLNTPIAKPDDWLVGRNTVYIEHGVNFGGTLNLFGGVTDQIINRLEELIEHKGNLVSLDIPMPDYAQQLGKRSAPRLTQGLLAALNTRLLDSTTLTQFDLKSDLVAIGDSHSTAYCPKGGSVILTNGLTLHGALEKGHFVEQIGRLVHKPRRVTLVCGSIDIRHHIGRFEAHEGAVMVLCNKYSGLIDFLNNEYGIEVEVAAPVPVEWEERKIPQTGFYKKTAFTGTQTTRRQWTNQFISHMTESHSVVSPPAEWYSMDGEEYAKTYMEPNSSVHIAPPFYRRNNWGQL